MNGFALRLLLLLVAAIAAPFALGEAGVIAVSPAQALTPGEGGSDNSGSGKSGSGGQDDGSSDDCDDSEDADDSDDSDEAGSSTSRDDDCDDKARNNGKRGRPPGLAKPRKPKRGKSVNATPARGTVKVRVPGSDRAVPLESASSVPVGSVLDARAGAVTIDAAASPTGGSQHATFSGAAYKLTQPATAGVTGVRLRGGSFRSCRTSRASVFSSRYSPLAGMARRRKSGRKLWGRGKGRFRTRGRHSAASVRGTVWMTEDRCDGTVTKVKRGRVVVRDRRLKRTIVLKKGDRYFARAK